ncbi:MAG: 2,3-diphosphoglycerate synthetase [Gaiellaceae bacterium]
MRCVAVIDGEHYAPVVRAALAELPYEVAGAWLAGGSEKLRGGDEYGVPVATSLDGAIDEWSPDLVYDLSDEPVLGPRERLALASRVLARGLPYEGPDFRFEPPEFAPVGVPSLAVVGTGKRVGKTAVTGHVARLLARDRRVVVVAMGRGGPPEPELVETPPGIGELLARVREGRHAASDHLETAALTGVPTVGCRRCGGGLAGRPGTTNVLEGVEVARGLDPDLVIIDGSGAALPPVAADARVLVIPAQQSVEIAVGYLNAYRILLADLVVLTHCEDGVPALREAVTAVKDVPVVATVQRPRPVEPVAGMRVAFFTTAPPGAHEVLAAHLRDEHRAGEVHVSGNLGDRVALRRDLERLDVDVFLVELKAAAVEVVAAEAVERGVRVVLADADLRVVGGGPELDDAIRSLVPRREAVA